MRHLLLGATLLMVAVAPPVLAQSASPSEPPRQISVTGTGEIDAAPDMATIRLGVTNEAELAKEAMDATSGAVAQVLDRLGALGLEPRDVQTSNLILNPLWSGQVRDGTGPQEITGFVASNTVVVRVRALETLGEVLQAVLEDGANTFDGLQLSVQEPKPLEDEARRLAVKDAMDKAALLAEASGLTLGPGQSIADHGGGGPVMMEMASARMGGGVPIAAGEVTVSASVSMVFSIAGE